jgi:hypothetical protein
MNDNQCQIIANDKQSQHLYNCLSHVHVANKSKKKPQMISKNLLRQRFFFALILRTQAAFAKAIVCSTVTGALYSIVPMAGVKLSQPPIGELSNKCRSIHKPVLRFLHIHI